MSTAIEALKAHGQTLAGGDDVAAAVEAAQRAQPAPGRRVIALSGALRTDSDEADGPASPERELTRTRVDGGVGSFTIRIAGGDAPPARDDAGSSRGAVPTTIADPADPAPSTPAPMPRPAPVTPTMEDPSAAPAIPLNQAPSLVHALAIVAGALALALAVGLGSRALLSPSRAPVLSASTEPPELERRGRHRRASEDPPPLLAASTTATADVAPPLTPAPPRSIAPRATAAVTAAPSATPADGCTGGVRIASTGSWIVSGGPQSVQSPGVYTWRCGTFALSAISRADATQHKQASVTVRAGGTALVDLR
jgi:hypothetical protein